MKFSAARTTLQFVLPLIALLALQACMLDNQVAGGSSEVDNPQIKVAFIDDAGATVAFTGSVALFLADQNPALEPDPLLEVQLNNDTAVFLSAAFLRKAGTTPSFNLLARGTAGNGALLKSFSYDTTTRTLTVNGTPAEQLAVPLAPLVSYAGTVSLEVNGPERVFVPGTPFQAVVVADSFAFHNFPEGVFPLRVFSSAGVEHEFPELLDTREKGHFALDTNLPPIPRPEPPPLQLVAEAGADQSVLTTSQTFLSGQVTGVMPNDERLGVLWRQVFTDPFSPWVHIDHPASLNTRVRFQWPGVYRFVLSLTVGSTRVEDTVTIGVQLPTDPEFYEPQDTTQWRVGRTQIISWFGFNYTPDTLDLLFSRDSGTTWETILNNTTSLSGFNHRPWTPQGVPSANCFLRLRRNDGSIAATSKRFSLTESSMNMPASTVKRDYGDKDGGYHHPYPD